MVLPNWTKLAAKIAVVVAVVGWAYYLGYNRASDAADADKLKIAERVIAEQQEMYEKDLEVLLTAQDTSEKAKELVDETKKQTESVESPECDALGDDWLRLYNNSIDAANM